jgi:hypothetical protein
MSTGSWVEVFVFPFESRLCRRQANALIEEILVRGPGDLHSRVHRGAYRTKPSRRVSIPKTDRRQHSLGIAALEDKVAQQAVVTTLCDRV